MEASEAYEIIDGLVYKSRGKHLSDIQKVVFFGSWQSQTYKDIAKQEVYTEKYISEDVGPNLWKLLSSVLNENVSKTNFKTAIERHSNNSSNWLSPKPVPDFYVERPPIELLCCQILLQPGALVRIKAPALMGKTSLMARVLPQLAQQGFRTAYLNLHYAETVNYADLNKFLKWFCVSVGQSLGLPNLLAKQWDEEISTPKLNCSEYFERNFLSLDNSVLVLCLDKVDQIFPHPEVSSEFLGLLRAWHEQGKIIEIWGKLRLVVIHSTETYTPLNINESPFNVGQQIDLPEFTSEQIQELSQLYGSNWTDGHVKQLMEMIGGHPYLVGKAFSHLRSYPTMTLDELLQTATASNGIYRSHLRHLWYMLEKRPELMAAMADVVNADNSIYLKSEQLTYQLISMGVVCFDRNDRLVPRCNLYRKYFRDRVAYQQEYE